MGSDQLTGTAFVRRLASMPVDIAAVVAVVVLVNATIFLPVVRETPLRVPFVLAFVLFVPGYVFIAALYPERGEPAGADGHEPAESPDSPESHGSFVPARWRSGIDGVERVALSFGLSFVIVPAIGFPLTLWYDGVHLVPITFALTGFTLLMAAVATARRFRLPAEERFTVPYGAWLATGRSRLFSPDDGVDAALTILLIASVLLALGSLGFAATTLPQEDEFSSISLLVETDDGELVADDYPTSMADGASEEFVIAVTNHEYRTAEYTLVVVEQSLEPTENGTVVDEQREVDRFEFSLEHNSTELIDYSIEPAFTGEGIRIAWLLYVDEAPDEISIEEAPNHVYLMVDVE